MLLGEVLKNINKKHKKIRFSNIKFDSRDCKPNDLFFAISGNNSDGNRYIKNAIKKKLKPKFHWNHHPLKI